MGKKAVIPLVVLIVMCLSVAGYLVADAFDKVPGIITMRPHDPRLAIPETTPGNIKPSALQDIHLNPDAPMPDASAVQGEIDGFVSDVNSAKGAGGAEALLSIKVTDTLTGKTLGQHSADAHVTPASTNKVFTAVTALEVLGGNRHFETRCKFKDSTLYLVAGGDQMMASGHGDSSAIEGRAGLKDLADQCSQAVKKSKSASVKLRLDDTVYGSERVNPEWKAQNNQQWAAPIDPIAINVGYTNEQHSAHSDDPAMDAANEFETQLKEAGVKVDGSVERGQAPKGAKTVGSVRSASVAEIADIMLTRSDNSLAEGLCFASAVESGKKGSFADATQTVRNTVKKFGVEGDDLNNHDCSGLSENTKTSANALTKVLQQAASPKHPELQTLSALLPISALSGTLANRYFSDGVAGHVRVKTGSLSGVSAIAGYLMTKSGRVLTVVALTQSADGAKHAAAYQQLNSRIEAIAKM